MAPGTEFEKKRAAVGANVHRARREIAMNDALRVQQLERRQKMLRNPARFRRRDASTHCLHVLGERSRLVMVHHQIDRFVRIEDGAHPHHIRVRDFSEHRSLEREPMQRSQEIALVVGRMRAYRDAVGTARHKAARDELFDDDYVAIELVICLIAERERARSPKATNQTKAISEERSRTERERVVRLQGVGVHTISGGGASKLIAQRMPV
jgi:hypothetical protein